MIKKTSFIFIVVCNLLFYMAVGNCLADEASDYSGYWDEGDYAKVVELASAAISEQPDAAMWAHHYKARAAFKRGDYATAEASCQKLLSEYSHVEDATWALNEVAHYYQNEGQHDKARRIYEETINKTPSGNSHLLRTHAELAKIYVRGGDFVSVNNQWQNMLSDYSDHPKFDVTVKFVYSAYWDKGDYAKVDELTSAVISRQPKAAMWAHSYKARAAFKRKDYATAEASCQKLAANYNHTGAAWTVKAIGKFYLKEHKYDKARQMYEMVIATWPDDISAVMARADLITVIKQQGDLELAKAKIEELFAAYEELADEIIQNYSTRKDSAKYLNAIADNYRRYAYFERSNELYQQIVNSPDRNISLNAHAGIGMNYAWLGEDAKAQSKVDLLFTSYKNHPKLGFGVHMIGEGFYFKATKSLRENDEELAKSCYQNAISVWARSIDQINDSEHKCYAYYYSAIAYQHLEDYQKAAKYFEEVVNGWPDYDRRWHAISSMAQCYDILKNQNKMPASEANQKIQMLYVDILDNYPESMAANVAKIWLAECSVAK